LSPQPKSVSILVARAAQNLYDAVMDQNVSAIERAFQLAKSGSCETVEIIKRQLRTEGYGITQITGSALLRQLRTLIKAARKE
jgi:hypothetical protein